MTSHSSSPSPSQHPSRSNGKSKDERQHRHRAILIDANVHKGFGKTFQLAQSLARGSLQLGWQPVFVSHQDFDDSKAFGFKVSTARIFQVDNLIQWSLGVDGQSSTRRDTFGKPFGGTSFQNAWMRISEKLVASEQRAESMLHQWADGFVKMLKTVRPSSTDVIVINHCNDFTLLALAAAFRQSPYQPTLQIEAILHSPIYLPNQTDKAEIAKQYAAQVNDCLSLLRPHRVQLHASCIQLAKQIQASGVRQTVGVIDLPVQSRPTLDCKPVSDVLPIKVIIAGNPNKNQRHPQLLELLDEIYQTHLETGKFRLATRPLTDHGVGEATSDAWRRVVPSSLHVPYERGLQRDPNGSIEIVSHQLSGEAYHQWLDSADLGLFLYDPSIYHARASSVLNDMLIRGIPVIVPDKCTLADEVRVAGGHRSVGLIYKTPNEIPGLMQQFAEQRRQMTERAATYATQFAARHDARRTLSQLGMTDQNESLQVA